MPKKDKDDTPDNLKPFLSHGLVLDYSKGSTEATGDCIFCERDDRFSINIESSRWHCLKCGEKGNQYSFLSKLLTLSEEATEDDDYKELAADRNLNSVSTLKDWRLAKSVLTDEWLLPGYNEKGNLTGLYRWVRTSKRKYWLPTEKMGHHLFGMNLLKDTCETVAICEGPWDTMCMLETLNVAKESLDGSWVPTSSDSKKLANQIGVVGIPGAMTFYDKWAAVFEDRIVWLMCQNDHPRENTKTKKMIQGASHAGMERISGILSKSETPPKEIHVLEWGEGWYDGELPSGYDIRDYLTEEV